MIWIIIYAAAIILTWIFFGAGGALLVIFSVMVGIICELIRELSKSRLPS